MRQALWDFGARWDPSARQASLEILADVLVLISLGVCKKDTLQLHREEEIAKDRSYSFDTSALS